MVVMQASDNTNGIKADLQRGQVVFLERLPGNR